MPRNELYHYRTKGSKNGVSTDPNYTPIGQRAQPAWMPGSAASRQYRDDRQQQARMQAEEAIKRVKSSATSTANSGISRINSAASKAAIAAEDARIKQDLARREAEKKRQQWVQDRKDNWNRGVSAVKTGLTSAGNEALKKSGARLQISGKRGVGQNPYEQGYTGTRRTKDVTKTNPQNAMNQRISEARQRREDMTGKNGRLAQAKAYGKEGLDAATRIANQARNLPGRAKSEWYKKRYEISANIADAKREAQQSEAYKRTKAGVETITRRAKKLASTAASKAEHMQYNALEKYTGLNKSRVQRALDAANRRKQDEAYRATVDAYRHKGFDTSTLEKPEKGSRYYKYNPATREEQMKVASDKLSKSVGDEAERLKRKGLAILKKLRK